MKTGSHSLEQMPSLIAALAKTYASKDEHVKVREAAVRDAEARLKEVVEERTQAGREFAEALGRFFRYFPRELVTEAVMVSHRLEPQVQVARLPGTDHDHRQD